MSATLGKYVSSLLPSFEKSQIEEDVRILKEDLVENTVPSYKAAAEFFSDEGYTAKDVKDLDALVKRRVNVERALQGHMVSLIHNVLRRMVENLSIVEAKVDSGFGRDVTSDGMTYARANVLRFIEVMSFTTKYARKLLFWIYHKEQASKGKDLENPLTPAEEKWLVDNQNSFFRSLEVVGKKGSDLEVALKNIPDMVVVPKESDVADRVVGRSKLDPLSMGFLPVKINPIYHVRMAITDFQIHRYKVAKEEKRALEYRLLALKESQQGRADANLEKQIQYTENRIKKLNYRLAKIEED